MYNWRAQHWLLPGIPCKRYLAKGYLHLQEAVYLKLLVMWVSKYACLFSQSQKWKESPARWVLQTHMILCNIIIYSQSYIYFITFAIVYVRSQKSCPHSRGRGHTRHWHQEAENMQAPSKYVHHRYQCYASILMTIRKFACICRALEQFRAHSDYLGCENLIELPWEVIWTWSILWGIPLKIFFVLRKSASL